MTTELFWQMVLNGLALGQVYVLVASGLALLMGTSRIFNFAHGEFYMGGAFAVFTLTEVFHINYGLALLLAIFAMSLLGAICYRFLLSRTQGNFLLTAVVTLGLSMIMAQSAVLSLRGTDFRCMPSIIKGMMNIGGVELSAEKVSVIILCFLFMGMLHYFLKRTKTGMAMRAIALDSDAAALQGVNNKMTFLASMAVGCALAGAAGGIIAPMLAISSTMGHDMLLYALMVLILGGMGSIPGAVVGGLTIGLAESFGHYFLGGGIAEAFVFGFVAIIVYFRPQGLMGHPLEID